MPGDDVLALGSASGGSLVGRFCAVKWASVGRGGWCFGVITKQLSDASEVYDEPIEASPNYMVHYDCDDEDVSHVFYSELYASDAKADYHQWVLLEERHWSYVPEEIFNPTKPTKKGRPSSARKKPAAGPTAKKPKKGA